jgi:Putative MetA-pathway of phenol degradation
MNKRLVFLAWLLLMSALTIHGQQAVRSIPITDTLTLTTPIQTEEEEFIKPSRPSLANPAEIQKAGVLQLEFGYDVNLRSQELHSEQTVPLTLRYAVTNRLLLEADLDAVKSESEETGVRTTGVGDTRLGLQVVALKDTQQHPALAFAYYIKLPSASASKGLGTGRVDHKFMTLVSKKIGGIDMDLNGAVLLVGREDADGWITGGQGALSFEGQFENGFGLQGELSGQTKDDVQPKGLYALGALTYKVNKRLVFDAGMRFGLNPDAPRVGFFTGITVGVADFHEK